MINKNLNNLRNNNKTFVIAEAGSNHLQDLKRAYELVDIAKRSGADAIKFQSFTADEIATKNFKFNKIKNKFKKFSNNLYDFYKKFELPEEFNFKISKYCKKKNILFLTSVFGKESLLLSYNLSSIIKIASFEANYYELFDDIIKLKKPIIVSTGCSSENHILKIKNFFSKKKYTNFAILHCGSAYPLNYKDANLNYIKRLKKIFPINTIGYSDHTMGIETCLAAVSLGARIIEKHFTISKDDGAPDSFFSLEEKELKLMVDGIRKIEQSFGRPKKILTKSIKSMANGQRSYYALENFEKGKLIKKNMLKALRPYVKNSISIEKYFEILNKKKLKKKIKKDFPLMKYHI